MPSIALNGTLGQSPQPPSVAVILPSPSPVGKAPDLGNLPGLEGPSKRGRGRPRKGFPKPSAPSQSLKGRKFSSLEKIYYASPASHTKKVDKGKKVITNIGASPRRLNCSSIGGVDLLLNDFWSQEVPI